MSSAFASHSLSMIPIDEGLLEIDELLPARSGQAIVVSVPLRKCMKRLLLATQ